MKRLKNFFIAVLFTCSCLLCSCANTKLVTRDGFLLDTTVSISLFQPADTALLDGCFDLIGRYEALFSRTIEGSDIWRINHAGGQPVEVSEETAEVIEISTRFSALSNGAFDVTIEPVSRLWSFTASNPSLPDTDALQAAVKLVDYREIVITHATADSAASIRLKNAQAALDLGGIAKGYIADKLNAYLTGQGVTGALINLGGNLYAVGSKQGKAWSIGVRDPDDAQKLAAMLTVTNQSVVTSGSYERCFTLDGVLYHHILDPKTGEPVRNGLRSVTIVCPRSADADALSTACFVLGQERGLALIESLPDTEALFISEDGTLTASSGLQFTT